MAWTCVFACATPVLLAQDAPAEYQLKAAFVSKFAEFVEWPPVALDGRDSVDLCVAEPSPFGTALRDLVAGTQLRGRTLVAREVSAPDGIDTCHVLFVPAAPSLGRQAWLARASTRPILTIGDTPGFLEDGGILNLLVVDDRIRFDVDLVASTRAGLRLSSQLLQLALHVHGGQP
ncbi:MAG: YfiR family protein [Vicinamibacterales bacterium]